MVFLYPQPEEQALAAHYDEKYYGKDRKKFSGALEAAIAGLTWLKWRKLRAKLSRGDRLLDIGCGRGTLVRLARASGVEAFGVERETPGQASLPWVFYRELTECAFPGEHFHAVVLWHVLEHLKDPQQTLAEIHRILKPGGWLSLAVPNFGGAQAQTSGNQWFHLDLPRHLWHFREPTLLTLLERTGLECARSTTFSLEYDWFGTLQSWMNRALGDANGLYSMLKQERPQGRGEALRRMAAAGVLAGPALASALWDAARGQGGTVTVICQKRSGP